MTELDSLSSFSSGSVAMNKDELKRNLGIVHNALYGLSSCLPFWQPDADSDPQVQNLVPDTSVAHKPVRLMTMSEELEGRSAEKLTIKGGNARKAVIKVMDQVQVRFFLPGQCLVQLYQLIL